MKLYAIYHADTATYLALIEQDTDRYGEPVTHLGFVERIEDALQGTKEVIQEACRIIAALSPAMSEGVLIVPVGVMGADLLPCGVVDFPRRKRNAAAKGGLE